MKLPWEIINTIENNESFLKNFFLRNYCYYERDIIEPNANRIYKKLNGDIKDYVFYKSKNAYIFNR